jgi:CelD/BcsL family acetyltransferase involved in cellulose biosynthesis
MQTFIVSSESEWNVWRSSWNELTRINPMMSMEWLLAWWHQYGIGHQLHIIAVTSGDKLLGVLPCYLKQTILGKQIRLLGTGNVCSDYLGAIVDRNQATEVYEAIHANLRESVESGVLRGIESLQFEGVSSEDKWLEQLANFADKANFSTRTQPLANSWSLALPSTWAELHQSQRGHGVHRKAKKCISRLESNELCMRQITEVTGLDEGMEHLIRLHQARRESVGDDGCFADVRFESFLLEALAGMLLKGTACFNLCEKGSQVIGVQLLLLGSDTVFMYQSGVDPSYMSLEPGHALVTGSLLYSISHGYKAYDFLRGDEPYKAFWGAQAKELQKIVLAPPTFKAQAIEAVQRNLSWLRACYNDLNLMAATSQ